MYQRQVQHVSCSLDTGFPKFYESLGYELDEVQGFKKYLIK